MKYSVVAIALLPFLVACGGGGSKSAAKSSASSTSANAMATHSGPCPVVNGKFVREVGDQEQPIFLNTVAQAGNYFYSFTDPKLTRAQFQMADGVNHTAASDPNANDYYRLNCDASSITSISAEQGKATITIRYTIVDDAHVQVDATGGGDFLAGLYTKAGK